ncbi:hypothetical protein J4G33_06350 [Actinotalea sp. BY-33]|uniref:Uncharacterized protein n=1 Tax=Actinotalea soli TaxID=2819234 RepID=A0A939RVR7_9CELL|nr:hypothetical protein [Actinotalea soli]MBO1751421.1 hypothetical protein [Actinotalea soli]
MALYGSAEALVPGDLVSLRAAATAHADARRLVGTAGQDLGAASRATGSSWTGAAGDGFRAHAAVHEQALEAAGTLAGTAAQACDALADALEQLRADAGRVLASANAMGLGGAALTSNPVAVGLFLAAQPERTPDVIRLLGEIVRVRVAVGDAHAAFVVAIGGVTTSLGDRVEDRRTPDERGGRRIRSDELSRRDDPGNGHLSNDWAGRAILERYLRGGGDWVIEDDADWAEYMMANDALAADMQLRTGDEAVAAVERYLSSGRRTGSFDESFSQAIENGEGIVGYQYLHGTNAEVGGFEHSGSTRVTPRSDGTFEVVIDASYRWNDVIDPNPQYTTDQRKSWVAEVLTLGQADAYDIHIGWTAPTTVVVDGSGRVISIEGYPG